MVAPLGLLDYNWVNTHESRPYFTSVLNKQGTNLKKFGKLGLNAQYCLCVQD